MGTKGSSGRLCPSWLWCALDPLVLASAGGSEGIVGGVNSSNIDVFFMVTPKLILRGVIKVIATNLE